MEPDWNDAGAYIEGCKTLQDLNKVAYAMEPKCPDDEEWAAFCEDVTAFVRGDEAIEKRARQLAQNASGIEAALYDNYFDAALMLGLARELVPPGLPVLAWAAFNKKEYAGWRDEIATVRYLLWLGFDVNAGEADGTTALHYMAGRKHTPHAHPRAVDLLLRHGANPNAQRKNGDTPLCYMAGFVQWNDSMNASATLLLDAGADPFITSNDGETAANLLRVGNQQSPHEGRTALLARIGSILEAREIEKPMAQPQTETKKTKTGGWL